METRESRIASVLRDAADLIEKDGWWNGQPMEENSTPPNCAYTAIRSVATRELVLLTSKALADQIKKSDDPYSVIFGWNDAPDQTAEGVIEFMREVADFISPPVDLSGTTDLDDYIAEDPILADHFNSSVDINGDDTGSVTSAR